MNSHALPLQTGEALAGIVGHIAQPAPHFRKPALQVKSHVVPAHDGVPLAGALHARHALPQRRKPGSQVTLHCWFVQAATAFGSLGHRLHDDGPQLLTAVLGTQVWPQAC